MVALEDVAAAIIRTPETRARTHTVRQERYSARPACQPQRPQRLPKND